MGVAKKPFVVLDAEILSSSVWAEEPHVRLVWITLLILCDTEGYVGAAIPGIAHHARVTLKQAEDAIERLQRPDPYSRTKTNQGKRLEPAERGWKVLNFQEHIDRLSSERMKARERVRRHRERKRKRDGNASNVTVRPGNREQGTGNREQGQGTYVGTADERAEREVSANVDRLQLELGALLTKLAEHPNSRLMVPAWSALVTGYDKGDRRVPGRQDFRMIRSPERLQRSIKDAKAWFKVMEGGKVVDGRS